MFGVDETTGLAQQKILPELGIKAAQFSIRKSI
jgi:hypothetical protein